MRTCHISYSCIYNVAAAAFSPWYLVAVPFFGLSDEACRPQLKPVCCACCLGHQLGHKTQGACQGLRAVCTMHLSSLSECVGAACVTSVCAGPRGAPCTMCTLNFALQGVQPFAVLCCWVGIRFCRGIVGAREWTPCSAIAVCIVREANDKCRPFWV